MIVLDASATVEWLLGRQGASHVADLIADPDVSLHAPSYLAVEVMSALRGLTAGGHASAERAEVALKDLAATGIETHDPAPLISRAWQLRHNLSAYDAVYVALAEVLDATLVTRDARISKAPGLLAPVIVVGL